MKGEITDLVRFKHIRDTAIEITGFISEISEDEFYRSNLYKYAIEKCIMVIGEAASKISREALNDSRYKEWKKAIGMRGKLVHDYNGTDYKIVYHVAKEDIKPLLEEVNRIISELEKKN
jgi:uncharacterized protein with HEPN domain